MYGYMSREIQETKMLFDYDVIKDESCYLLYYVKDNIIVGYFVIDYVENKDKEKFPSLADMFVLDGYRKQGLANKFLDYYFNFIEEKSGSEYKIIISKPINIFLAKTILRKIKERGKNELYLVNSFLREPTSLDDFENSIQQFDILSQERNNPSLFKSTTTGGD